MSTRNDYSMEELADFAMLLWPARMVLDACAAALLPDEYEGTCRIPDQKAQGHEAERMAQRIVDLIGHSVIDEPPHALVLIQEAEERLRELLDTAVENDLSSVQWLLEVAKIHDLFTMYMASHPSP